MSALGDPPPPPKRVKSGHLLSEKGAYRLRRWQFVQDDGMVIIFFLGTIAINACVFEKNHDKLNAQNGPKMHKKMF